MSEPLASMNPVTLASFESPFAGMAMPAADGVARVTAAASSARLNLRAEPEIARSIGKALGIALDSPINRVTYGDGLAVLRLGPDEWLLVAETEDGAHLSSRIQEDAAGAPKSIVDVGQRSSCLVIEGDRVEAVLASGCPLPLSLSDFPVDKATRTVLAKAEIVLWRRSEAEFRLEVARSFVPYVVELLTTVIGVEAALLRLGRAT